MKLDWAASLLHQAHAAGAAFWMKQLGGVRDARHRLEDIPDALQIREVPRPC